MAELDKPKCSHHAPRDDFLVGPACRAGPCSYGGPARQAGPTATQKITASPRDVSPQANGHTPHRGRNAFVRRGLLSQNSPAAKHHAERDDYTAPAAEKDSFRTTLILIILTSSSKSASESSSTSAFSSSRCRSNLIAKHQTRTDALSEVVRVIEHRCRIGGTDKGAAVCLAGVDDAVHLVGGPNHIHPVEEVIADKELGVGCEIVAYFNVRGRDERELRLPLGADVRGLGKDTARVDIAGRRRNLVGAAVDV